MNKRQHPKPERTPPTENLTPGERTSRAILKTIAWFKDSFKSFHVKRPEGRVIEHRGQNLPSGIESRFTRVLIVEDNIQTASAIVDLIRNYYRYGKVTIYLAYQFSSAVSFFSHFTDGKKILVIMDSDLNDPRGDGATLTIKFHEEKPAAVILANSSSRVSNLQMESCGAVASIEKSYAKLHEWLQRNDPAANGK